MTKKFRAYDSESLSKQYEFAEAVVQKTIAIAMEAETEPADLPDSLVPTDSLLNLCLSYSIIYDKLVEYELAQHPKPNKTIH